MGRSGTQGSWIPGRASLTLSWRPRQEGDKHVLMEVGWSKRRVQASGQRGAEMTATGGENAGTQ